MSSPRPSTKELDALIEEATVDAYNGSGQLTAFLTAFEEAAKLPWPGTVVGEYGEVLSLTTVGDRVELVAPCRPSGHRITFHEVHLRSAPRTLRLFAAYKRWLSPGAKWGPE